LTLEKKTREFWFLEILNFDVDLDVKVVGIQVKNQVTYDNSIDRWITQ
jgi:hypothetical protein